MALLQVQALACVSKLANVLNVRWSLANSFFVAKATLCLSAFDRLYPPQTCTYTMNLGVKRQVCCVLQAL